MATMPGMGVADGWVEIGDRFFVRRYAFYDQNIGLVLGDGEALVIDTRSTYGQAREIVDHVREVTRDPVTVVVDTHGHFDHAFGNAIFRPATIWGQAGCVPFMERTGERRKAAIAADEPELADDLGRGRHRPARSHVRRTRPRSRSAGAPVELRFLGRGHTDHDAVITVPGTDVVWAGDLARAGQRPVLRRRLSARLGGDGCGARRAGRSRMRGVVVPGHGDHAGRAFADAQAASFAALAAVAQRRARRRADARRGHRRAPVPGRTRRSDAREAFDGRSPSSAGDSPDGDRRRRSDGQSSRTKVISMFTR